MTVPNAKWLRLGDQFLAKSGQSATVVRLAIRTERVAVYNLQVAWLHYYAVGHSGVLVHNSGPRISYAPRVHRRMAEDPHWGHNFPSSFDPVIINRPPASVTPQGYAVWRADGFVKGRGVIYEIGGYDVEGGLWVTHRFCHP